MREWWLRGVMRAAVALGVLWKPGEGCIGDREMTSEASPMIGPELKELCVCGGGGLAHHLDATYMKTKEPFFVVYLYWTLYLEGLVRDAKWLLSSKSEKVSYFVGLRSPSQIDKCLWSEDSVLRPGKIPFLCLAGCTLAIWNGDQKLPAPAAPCRMQKQSLK